MGQELSCRLHQAAQQTFEDLCFLCAAEWPAEEPPPPLAEAAAVRFFGEHRGRLELHCTSDALAVLTDNMLGGELAGLSLQRDALGELANVICGNLLPALAGDAAVYRLASPTRCAEEAGEHPTAQTTLQLERGAVQLRLFVSDP